MYYSFNLILKILHFWETIVIICYLQEKYYLHAVNALCDIIPIANGILLFVDVLDIFTLIIIAYLYYYLSEVAYLKRSLCIKIIHRTYIHQKQI